MRSPPTLVTHRAFRSPHRFGGPSPLSLLAALPLQLHSRPEACKQTTRNRQAVPRAPPPLDAPCGRAPPFGAPSGLGPPCGRHRERAVQRYALCSVSSAWDGLQHSPVTSSPPPLRSSADLPPHSAPKVSVPSGHSRARAQAAEAPGTRQCPHGTRPQPTTRAGPSFRLQ